MSAVGLWVILPPRLVIEITTLGCGKINARGKTYDDLFIIWRWTVEMLSVGWLDSNWAGEVDDHLKIPVQDQYGWCHTPASLDVVPRG